MESWEEKVEEKAREGWVHGVLFLPLDEALRLLLPGGWVGKRAVYSIKEAGERLEVRFACADAVALKTLMSSLAHTLRGVEATREALKDEGRSGEKRSEDL